MTRPRTHHRSLVSALLALTLVAACGSGDSDDDDDGDPAAPTPGGSSTAAAPDSAVVEFSGIVSVSAIPGVPTRLEIHDPDDVGGDPRSIVELPDAPSSTWRRSSFSADWRYAVWGDDPVTVGRLDPAAGTYTELFTLDPGDGGYAGGGVQYGNPAFAPNGSDLWVEVQRGDDVMLASIEVGDDAAADDLDDSDVSLPAGQLGADEPEWRFASTGDPVLATEDAQVAIGAGGDTTGQPGDWRATYWLDEAGGVVAPAVSVWAESNVEATYTEELRVGPAEFIVVAHAPTEIGFDDGAEAAREYGVVAHATIDPAAQDVTLDPLVPVGGDEQLALWSVVAPDESRALICIASPEVPDSGTAYLADLTGGGEPQEASDCGRRTEPLGWS
ncbi:hypothetical protein [Jiangella asiatica]|uniref:Uncharacterized protein n=1 Tax=Jiangella asiatica TaxID=2530372 RepID=A0A4R5CQ15_9ACTN|nr:hypothetical protein [Jiangella asiatica]TDE02572.1 hypothetical protein E1269_21545 [Jiangella asiatica]